MKRGLFLAEQTLAQTVHLPHDGFMFGVGGLHIGGNGHQPRDFRLDPVFAGNFGGLFTGQSAVFAGGVRDLDQEIDDFAAVADAAFKKPASSSPPYLRIRF